MSEIKLGAKPITKLSVEALALNGQEGVGIPPNMCRTPVGQKGTDAFDAVNCAEFEGCL